MDYHDGSALAPGTRVDQYIVSAVLGRGGFGITYHVRDEALNRDFALKEYFPQGLVQREGTSVRFAAHPNSESDYRWGLRKFHDEARLLAQFSHPNIVAVRRVFEANNSAYMLLDFVRGSTLEAWLRQLDSPPTQEELDLICGPLLKALELVHANRTWHLDISPDNIFIRAADGEPILLDFGASRFELKQHSQLVSAMVFKSGYSAPEQYTTNAGRLGPWTDIYAFGATLYRALSGRRPIEATERQLEDEARPATLVGKGRYREQFLEAIDWALKIPPRERPQSVRDWRKVLLTPESAVVAPPVTRIATGRGKGAAASAEPVPARPARAGRRVYAALAVLVLAAGGIAAFLPGASRWFESSPARYDRIGEFEKWGEAKRLPKPGAEQQAPEQPTPDGKIVPPVDRVLTAAEEERIAPGQAFQECKDCPRMTVVPAGASQMGSPSTEAGRAASEGPQHRVEIARPFALGTYEVTRDQYNGFVQATNRSVADSCSDFDIGKDALVERKGWSYRYPGYLQEGNHPAVCVSWQDARDYAAWLTRTTGREYRLASEAEWEYAARAGSQGRYHFGDDEARLCQFGNVADLSSGLTNRTLVACRDGFERTAPVGTFAPNAFGLYDTIGNVWELVEDCAVRSYEGAPTHGSAWLAGICTSRVSRGGGWGSLSGNLRSATRNLRFGPEVRTHFIGFRVARTLGRAAAASPPADPEAQRREPENRPPAMGPAQRERMPDTALIGDIIATESGRRSSLECRNTCLARAGCKAYEYRLTGSVCYLYRTVREQHSSNDAISGRWD